MISSFKLPFNFDSEALRSDLDRIAPNEWVKHFNQDYFEGEWSGVALRSSSGDSAQLNARVSPEISYADTPILQRCPYVREILSTLQCPLQSVRFLKLTAGSRIKEHRDYDLGFAEGQLRLHIPVTTNPDVKFFLDAHHLELKAGECWYIDFSLPHWIENTGATDRVHLVIDCQLNEWLRGLLPLDEAIGRESDQNGDVPSSPENLQSFRQAVFEDLKLQERIRQTDDRESFTRLVVDLGRHLGYRFNTTDVDNALNAEQKTWLERWID